MDPLAHGSGLAILVILLLGATVWFVRILNQHDANAAKMVDHRSADDDGRNFSAALRTVFFTIAAGFIVLGCIWLLIGMPSTMSQLLKALNL